ncbi:MAG: 50S ribosomal protein L17 [Desulfobulbaceae bacterium]|nr:50S ribosomal protein L17 [Desulfobulbaceae bacterium]
MRHRKAGMKLNRTSSHRKAMFRNMVTSLLKHERIRTTDVKAKELRRWADNLITLAKRGDVHARRQALSIVREKDVVHKLFAEAKEKYGTVSGGYTRIVKLGRRPGDAAPISLIELVFSAEDKKKKKAKKKEKAAIKRKEVAEKKEAVEEKKEEKKEAVTEEKAAEESKEILDKEEDETEVAAEVKPEPTSEDSDDKPEEQAEALVESEETEATEAEGEKAEDKKEDAESKE